MRRTIVCLLTLAPLFFISCNGKKAITYTRQIGEACNEIDQCQRGLYCEVNICRVLCNKDTECDLGLKCIDHKCTKVSGHEEEQTTDVDDTSDIDNTDSDTDKPAPSQKSAYPEGNGLSNISGVIQDGQFRIRILGGTLSGGAKNSTNSVNIINEGTWR